MNDRLAKFAITFILSIFSLYLHVACVASMPPDVKIIDEYEQTEGASDWSLVHYEFHVQNTLSIKVDQKHHNEWRYHFEPSSEIAVSKIKDGYCLKRKGTKVLIKSTNMKLSLLEGCYVVSTIRVDAAKGTPLTFLYLYVNDRYVERFTGTAVETRLPASDLPIIIEESIRLNSVTKSWELEKNSVIFAGERIADIIRKGDLSFLITLKKAKEYKLAGDPQEISADYGAFSFVVSLDSPRKAGTGLITHLKGHSYMVQLYKGHSGMGYYLKANRKLLNWYDNIIIYDDCFRCPFVVD